MIQPHTHYHILHIVHNSATTMPMINMDNKRFGTSETCVLSLVICDLMVVEHMTYYYQ